MNTLHSNAAARLSVIDTECGHGAATGYEKFLRALRTVRGSPPSADSQFEPGADPKASAMLASCRASCRRVRLIFGNTRTGESRLDDHDVVGKIGGSTDSPEAPLLLESEGSNGRAIACQRILAIIDWEFSECLYRHPAYREPELRIEFRDEPDRPWHVVRREDVVARFQDIGKAGAYLAFMRGASVEPRVFR
jgi:hypothetical protein